MELTEHSRESNDHMTVQKQNALTAYCHACAATKAGGLEEKPSRRFLINFLYLHPKKGVQLSNNHSTTKTPKTRHVPRHTLLGAQPIPGPS